MKNVERGKGKQKVLRRRKKEKNNKGRERVIVFFSLSVCFHYYFQNHFIGIKEY